MVPEINESASETSTVGLDKVFDFLAEKSKFFVNRLKDFVEFPTVSSDPSKKANIQEMATYLVETLQKFELSASVVPITFEEIQKDNLPPPLVLAETKMDSAKRTVCFYGHYDVRSLTLQDYWYGDPFVLTSANDGSVFYGKGTSMSKGPLLCLINAIGAYQKLRIPLPINIKLILDPMGMSDDEQTGKFIRKTTMQFFSNVDFVCLCTGQWLGNFKPCVFHGSRGLCYFTMCVEGSSKDLHSGNYGGLLNEPMTDLVYMMNQLVDKRGTIKISDLYQDVDPVTKEQKEYYNTLEFVVCDFKQDLGAQELLGNEDKTSLLINLLRMPSLTIHGIEGAFSDPGTKNIIPCKVTGKFSINLVPNMTPSKVKKKVFDYLSKIWKSRKSTNKITVQMTIGKLAWYTEPDDVNCIAAVNAVKRVYNEQPDLIRDSNRVRMANTLRRVTNASVIRIPVGKADDISDSDAEKIDLMNYINGCKTYAAYFQEISSLSPRVPQQDQPKCSCKANGLAECICYMKAGWMVEGEESSLEDSLLISSSEMSGGSQRGEPSASSRFNRYSACARKKIVALQKIICEGETVIGSKYKKDLEELMGEEESDGGRQELQYEKSFGATPSERSIAQSSKRLVRGEISDTAQERKKSFRPPKTDAAVNEEDSSYFSKPKAKEITDIAEPTSSSKVEKLGLSPSESKKSGPFSLAPDTKAIPKDQQIDDNFNVVQQGYVGKRPFPMSTMSGMEMAVEPYGIISSLSALLFKRRIERMKSPSVKTLAGSRLMNPSRRNSQGPSDTWNNSSAPKLPVISTSKLKTDLTGGDSKDAFKVHQVFMNIDSSLIKSNGTPMGHKR